MPDQSVAPGTSQSEAKPRCAHHNAAGRRCRLRVLDNQSGLCFRHFSLQQTALARDSQAAAAELLSGVRDFSSAGSINLYLGNIVRQLAHRRISRPDAVALAYLGQLLMNTLPALKREIGVSKTSLPRETAALLASVFPPPSRNIPSTPHTAPPPGTPSL